MPTDGRRKILEGYRVADATIEDGLARAIAELPVPRQIKLGSTARRLRNLFRGALPLRVTERLTSDVAEVGRARDPTDAAHAHQERETTEPGPGADSAILLDVLDVADRLYERVGAVLRPVGLSYPGYELLERLYRTGGALSMERLAHAHGCGTPTLRALVERLERDGLIAVGRTSSAVEIALEPAGRVRTLVARTRIAAVSGEFRSAMEGADRVVLGRLLSRVRER